jgi:hypothetical protein
MRCIIDIDIDNDNDNDGEEEEEDLAVTVARIIANAYNNMMQQGLLEEKDTGKKRAIITTIGSSKYLCSLILSGEMHVDVVPFYLLFVLFCFVLFGTVLHIPSFFPSHLSLLMFLSCPVLSCHVMSRFDLFRYSSPILYWHSIIIVG